MVYLNESDTTIYYMHSCKGVNLALNLVWQNSEVVDRWSLLKVDREAKRYSQKLKNYVNINFIKISGASYLLLDFYGGKV